MRRRHAKISAALILVAGASLLAAGVVAATDDLRDAARHPDRLHERSVGHGVTLAVIVSDASGEAVPGAHVHIVLLKDGEQHRITRDTTDREGRAVFELRPGGYEIHVRSDQGDAVERVRLHESQRLHVSVGERPSRG